MAQKLIKHQAHTHFYCLCVSEFSHNLFFGCIEDGLLNPAFQQATENSHARIADCYFGKSKSKITKNMKTRLLCMALLCATSMASMAAERTSNGITAVDKSEKISSYAVIEPPLMCTTVSACGKVGSACGYGAAELAEAAGYTAAYLCSQDDRLQIPN